MRGTILSLGVTLLFATASSSFAQKTAVSSLSSTELSDYAEQPAAVRRLIDSSLGLTRKNLSYTFGSCDPAKGGMDCSGTVQYVLKGMGVEGVPRTSFAFYQWVRKTEKWNSTRNVYSLDDPAFAALKPGDLLFWEGTYSGVKHSPPISHVMIYLGTLRSDQKGVVFGASSGRRYRGKKIHGVSVFDLKVPAKSSKASLVGYASIPGMSFQESVLISETESVEVGDKKKPKGLGAVIKNIFSPRKKREVRPVPVVPESTNPAEPQDSSE